jgi:hypothetical protein
VGGEGSVISATPVHDTSAEGMWSPRFKLKKHIISIKAHTNQHSAAKQIKMHLHAGLSISTWKGSIFTVDLHLPQWVHGVSRIR